MNGSRQLWAKALVVGLAVTLMATGCGSKTKSDEAAKDSIDDKAKTTQTTKATIPDSTVGVTDTEVRIGIHVPNTRGGIPLGSILGLSELSTAYWNSVNAAGGINDRKIIAEIADDGYDVSKALDACRELESKNVLFISGTSGADQIVACAQYALGKNIPYLSLGVSEAGLVDQAGYRALTMTYDRQGKLAAQYVANNLDGKIKKTAMVMFNSPNVEGARKQFRDELKKQGGTLVADDLVDKQGNANELAAECLKLKGAGADIVYVLALPTISSGLARSCTEQGYTPQFFMPANSAACGYSDPIYAKELSGCQSLSAVKVARESGSPLVEAAYAGWKATFPDRAFPDGGETFWGLFDIYREAIDKAGKNISRRSFLAALDSMKGYDNKLFNPIDFTKDNVGSDSVVVQRADKTKMQFDQIIGEWTSEF